MKFSSAILAGVLATTSASSITSPTAAELQEAVDRAQVQPLGRGMHLIRNRPAGGHSDASHRRADIDTSVYTPECAAETEQIAFDEALLTALYELDDHCPTTFTQEEPITVTSDFTKCDNDAVTNFRLTCNNADGQNYDQNLNMSCDINGQLLQVVFNQFPECVGRSCTEGDINQYKNDAFLTVVETLAIQFPGIKCSQVEFVEVVQTIEVDDIEEVQYVDIEFEDQGGEGSFDFESELDSMESTDSEVEEDEDPIEREDGSNDRPEAETVGVAAPSGATRGALSALAMGLAGALACFP